MHLRERKVVNQKDKDPFKEYLKDIEYSKLNKSYIWQTTIGLQAVDGLKPSKYLIDKAIENINGLVTLREVQNLIESYYEQKPNNSEDTRDEEADKVAIQIAQILSENSWYFRNDLVRANYSNLQKGIYETIEYLERFIRNLLLNEQMNYIIDICI